jgi:hypothetical protein
MDIKAKKSKATKANHSVHENMDHGIAGQPMSIIIAKFLIGLVYMSTCLSLYLMGKFLIISICSVLTRRSSHQHRSCCGPGQYYPY